MRESMCGVIIGSSPRRTADKELFMRTHVEAAPLHSSYSRVSDIPTKYYSFVKIVCLNNNAGNHRNTA
jgi:hypothetical protein